MLLGLERGDDVLGEDRAGRHAQQREILTLHADQQWRGAGTASIEAAGSGQVAGGTRVRVMTTNDNVDAWRFTSAAASAGCG